MTKLALNYLEAGAVAIIIYYLGIYIKTKVQFLRDYFIPAPVVGGLVFAIVNLILHQSGIMYITFDNTLQKFFMTMFFTSVGFSARLSLMKKGGKELLFMAIACTMIIVMQDLVGVFGAKFFDLPALLGLAIGSVPLIGGHGTAGAFGPLLEGFGATGAAAASIAVATFGLVAGGLVGGPVASRLINVYKLHGTHDPRTNFQAKKLEKKTETSSEYMLRALAVLLVAMGAGSVLTTFIGSLGLVLPGYLGGMVIAAIITNLSSDNFDRINFVPFAEISMLGSMSLEIFLSMALMGLALWDLVTLAIPLVVITAIQIGLICLFAYFVIFRIMGKDYEASVFSSAVCGFGLGATPTAMANMRAITAKHGSAPLAFIIVPLTGSLIIDFVNASIITMFINIFK